RRLRRVPVRGVLGGAGALLALIVLAALGILWQLWERDYFWHNPLLGARVERLTDFEGDELDAAISPDGKFGIFSSDRPGQPDAGDPIFIADRNASNPKRLFAAKPGVHCHYLTWSPDGRYVYFVRGTPSTEEMDIWRIPITSTGQAPIPERMTHHNARVAYLS